MNEKAALAIQSLLRVLAADSGVCPLSYMDVRNELLAMDTFLDTLEEFLVEFDKRVDTCTALLKTLSAGREN